MADIIERVISDTGNFFGIACNTTELVAEACRRHDVGPTAAAALGRALTGAALLAALLKDDQSVLLRFEGNGPLRKIITEAGYNGWVRGYVANPYADVPLKDGRIDVASGIGKAGFLTVIKTIGQDQKYPGTIQLYTSEIGEDLAYYLSQSEQTPSAIALSIHLQKDGSIAAAGGFLVQSLPPADENILSRIEQEIAALPPLSALLLAGKSPDEILSILFKNVPHRNIGSRALHYSCSCNHEKMRGALVSLGTKDLTDILEKEGDVEVCCEFCRQSYRFSGSELSQLIEEEKSENDKTADD
ncbi:MAG: heat shock protein Hsp33 [Desulfobulbaceae bacterium BRH_c16a]|nr:MAG: heat shock protein Hsp33 [Desulfobulbaceae bacterium BRH_c16a]